MRGHIIKRYKNSYTIVLNLGRDPASGKRRQEWVSVKGTRKEAEKRLAELLHQLDNGNFMRPGKTTLGEYLQRWLKDYAQPNLSPRGFERYESIIRKHLVPSLGSMPLTQLKPEHIQRHYSAKLNDGLSARSVRYHHVVLHVALQSAVKWGMVSRNVADAVEPPRCRSTEMKTWDKDEAAHFLEAARETPYFALFYCALFTGARRSELLGLKWGDVDLLLCQMSISRSLHHLRDGSYVFTQPKSDRSRRTVALPPSAATVLRQHFEKQKLAGDMIGKTLTGDDLVFAHVDGNPLRPNTVSHAWTTLAARCGVKVIRFHDARHTHASLMLKDGTHPKIVQERLGHSTIAVTLDTYSHVAPGLQAAAAQRFDEAFNFGHNTRAAELASPRSKDEVIEKFG